MRVGRAAWTVAIRFVTLEIYTHEDRQEALNRAKYQVELWGFEPQTSCMP